MIRPEPLFSLLSNHTVSASVPRIDCWGSSHTRHDWERAAIDVLDAYPGVVYESYAAAHAFSRQCEAHLSEAAPGFLEHISTASHAHDMLVISEAAGQLRLKYWGISYGSILGGTFAAMFPGRVERLVSDGNVDYTSWYRLDHRNFFEDTDSIMEAFFHFCHKAGPARCAFHCPSSPAAIKDRFFALLAQLRERPVLIPAHAFDAARKLPILPQLVLRRAAAACAHSTVQALVPVPCAGHCHGRARAGRWPALLQDGR